MRAAEFPFVTSRQLLDTNPGIGNRLRSGPGVLPPPGRAVTRSVRNSENAAPRSPLVWEHGSDRSRRYGGEH